MINNETLVYKRIAFVRYVGMKIKLSFCAYYKIYFISLFSYFLLISCVIVIKKYGYRNKLLFLLTVYSSIFVDLFIQYRFLCRYFQQRQLPIQNTKLAWTVPSAMHRINPFKQFISIALRTSLHQLGAAIFNTRLNL